MIKKSVYNEQTVNYNQFVEKVVHLEQIFRIFRRFFCFPADEEAIPAPTSTLVIA